MKCPIFNTRKAQLKFSRAYVIHSSRTLLAFKIVFYIEYRCYSNKVQATFLSHLNNCNSFPALSSPFFSNYLDHYLHTYLISNEETPPLASWSTCLTLVIFIHKDPCLSWTHFHKNIWYCGKLSESKNY